MCGLGGFYKHNGSTIPADFNDEVENLLCFIEDRGGHSYGYAVATDSGFTTRHHIGKPTRAHHHFPREFTQDVRFVMMHTRFATKGDIRDHRNTHPLHYHGKVVTHNGVLSNDDAVFSILPVERQAAVDSEAVNAALSCLGPELAFRNIEGSASVVWFDENEPSSLFLFTNGRNPLAMGEHEGMTVWASRVDHLEDLGASNIYRVPPWTIVHLHPEGIETWKVTPPEGAVLTPMFATRRGRVF